MGQYQPFGQRGGPRRTPSYVLEARKRQSSGRRAFSLWVWVGITVLMFFFLLLTTEPRLPERIIRIGEQPAGPTINWGGQ